jgi:radical SAM protein with 4Fe4S-binding SPASM domain
MKAPLTVYMELTRDCNISCNHCLITKEKVEMPSDKAKVLLDQLIQERVFKVYFTGGEPLLYPGLIELLEHIKGKPIWSLVMTNGLLVTDEIAENLNRAGLGACDLPLYGITPETHDSVTGIPGSFDTLFQALEILNNHNVRTFVSFVVLRPNVKELPRFFDWALERGIPLAHVRRFIPRYPGDELLPDMGELVPTLVKYAPLRDEYDEKGLHYEIEEAFDFAELEGDRCPAGIQLCFITAEGLISPCPYLLATGESVFEKGFNYVWENSSILKRARNAKISKGKCTQCAYTAECGGGCIAAAYQVAGTFEEPDPYCYVHPDKP